MDVIKQTLDHITYSIIIISFILFKTIISLSLTGCIIHTEY